MVLRLTGADEVKQCGNKKHAGGNYPARLHPTNYNVTRWLPIHPLQPGENSNTQIVAIFTFESVELRTSVRFSHTRTGKPVKMNVSVPALEAALWADSRRL